jgi:hypothetical protein
MTEIMRQILEKSIRDNGASPTGIIDGPNRVMLFRYRGLDMAMYADEINYQSVKSHIQEKVLRYDFPKCVCGRLLPANHRRDSLCVMCNRYGPNH